MRRRYVGIQLGSSSVRVAICKGRRRRKIVALKERKIGAAAAAESEEGSQSAVELAMRLVDEADVSLRSALVGVCIGADDWSLRHLELPRTDDRTLARLVRNEAPETLAGDDEIEAVAIRRTASETGGKLQPVVAWVLGRRGARPLHQFNGAGRIRPIPDLLAASSAVEEWDPADTGTWGVVDLGASHTGWILMHGSTPGQARYSPIGGHRLTRCIAEELGVDVEEAERLKRASGVSANDESSADTLSVQKLLRGRLTPLLQSIRLSLIKHLGGLNVSEDVQLVLVGGGARLAGLPELLEKELGVSARVFQPLDADLPRSAADLHRFAPALGAANPDISGFYRFDAAATRVAVQQPRRLILPTVAMVVAILTAATHLWIEHSQVEQLNRSLVAAAEPYIGRVEAEQVPTKMESLLVSRQQGAGSEGNGATTLIAVLEELSELHGQMSGLRLESIQLGTDGLHIQGYAPSSALVESFLKQASSYPSLRNLSLEAADTDQESGGVNFRLISDTNR